MSQLSGSGAPVDRFVEGRLNAAAFLIAAVWLVLIGRLFYLQVLEGDRYRISAERNSVRTHRVMAPRGMILDRSGRILVDSRPSFDVLVVPHEASDLQVTLSRVGGLIGVDPEKLREALGTPRGGERFMAQPVAHDLSWRNMARVESRLWALEGVLTQAAPVRSYPYKASAAHVLGWLGEIDKEQLRRREFQGYRLGDVIGREGVERLLDRELRGRAGGRNVLVDAHGRELERLDALEPQPGLNVVLTLDHRLQQTAETALAAAGRAGAVVALDPRNGEVLVLASLPAFNPNAFAAGIDRAAWQALTENPDTPLHNRALQGQYPPGSTYKVVTALAGLDAGVIKPDETVTCNGSYRLGRRRYRCWRREGHGTVDLHRAIVESCDVYFYRLSQQLGVDRLGYYARALGLGVPTGIDLRGEAAGLVPTAAWKERRFGEPWQEGESLSLGIGQGFNLWTPIQLAEVYAAIAMGGERHRPFIVKRIEDSHGKLVEERRPATLGEVAISKESLTLVRDALRGAVQEESGTGYVMRKLPGGVIAAGKTGTAQVVALAKDPPPDEEDVPEELRDHAWFVTFAPVEDPRIVVAVMVEHGGHGASAAAPVARKVVVEFLTGERDRAPGGTGDEPGGGELHARN